MLPARHGQIPEEDEGAKQPPGTSQNARSVGPRCRRDHANPDRLHPQAAAASQEVRFSVPADSVRQRREPFGLTVPGSGPRRLHPDRRIRESRGLTPGNPDERAPVCLSAGAAVRAGAPAGDRARLGVLQPPDHRRLIPRPGHASPSPPLTPAVTARSRASPDAAWVPNRVPECDLGRGRAAVVSDARSPRPPSLRSPAAADAEHVTARLIVRRVRRLNPKRSRRGSRRCSRSTATTRSSPTAREPMLAAEATHRDHAIIEQVIADLKLRAGAPAVSHRPRQNHARRARVDLPEHRHGRGCGSRRRIALRGPEERPCDAPDFAYFRFLLTSPWRPLPPFCDGRENSA